MTTMQRELDAVVIIRIVAGEHQPHKGTRRRVVGLSVAVHDWRSLELRGGYTTAVRPAATYGDKDGLLTALPSDATAAETGITALAVATAPAFPRALCGLVRFLKQHGLDAGCPSGENGRRSWALVAWGSWPVYSLLVDECAAQGWAFEALPACFRAVVDLKRSAERASGLDAHRRRDGSGRKVSALGRQLLGYDLTGLSPPSDIAAALRVLRDSLQHVVPLQLEPEPLKCLRCGEIGHMADTCHKAASRECFGCGAVGHVLRNCPNVVCLTCGGRGHVARQCGARAASARVFSETDPTEHPHHLPLALHGVWMTELGRESLRV
jgi:Zinc knuckle